MGAGFLGGEVSPEKVTGPGSSGMIRARTLAAESTGSRILFSRRSGVRHYRAPAVPTLSEAERRRIIVVFGGLNWRHDYLAKAVFEGAGYRCEVLPTPDEEAYELGYRYCSPGQCNPLYFTAGSLLKFLQELERRGLSRSEIIRRYVFFFPLSCGPCRFGMYEADYRAALRLAGFADFRVVPFNLHGGIHQDEREGLRYGIDFGLGIYKALLLADLLRDMTFQIRPYERRPGETDRVFQHCLDRVAAHLREAVAEGCREEAASARSEAGRVRKVVRWSRKIRQHLRGRGFREVLDECRRRIAAIEVDRLQVKPVVKLTGELFAHLTEGPGNYGMFSVLEEEGAEVFPDPLGAMLTHLLYQRRRRIWHRRAGRRWRNGRRLPGGIGHLFPASGLPLWFAELVYCRHYLSWGRALGGLARPLTPQADLVRLAEPFYDPLLRGGEAHLEIGKTLYYTLHRYCHAVLSLKPFGCMPSTQSDGAQAAVQGRFPDLLFLSLETGHDGAVLARSRVQMLLAEARHKAREEFERVLRETNWEPEAVRRVVERRPELRSALYPVPWDGQVAATAARFVHRVAREVGPVR